MAQLSGTYTIDSATVTGGTNFQSFTDFSDSLDANGVSGAVTVNVVASSGPYNEQINLPEVSGASATNTITINGNGEKIWTENNEAVITFDGGSYYTISNLAIEHQGTANATRCIRFHSESNYNTIKGCDMTITKYTGSSSSSAYIMFTASATTRSAGLHGSYNKIDGNKFSGGGDASKGPYYGVAYYGGASGVGMQNEFINNDLQQYYYYGMYSWYGEDLKINDNKIHDARSDSRAACAVFVSGISTSTSGQCQVNDNEIYDNSASGNVWGIYSTGTNGSSTNVYEIVGNDIHDNTSTGTYRYFYGIYKNRGSNGLIKGNEIHANESSDGYLSGIYTYFTAATDLIDGNAIHGNTQDGYQWGSLYGIQYYYSYGTVINNVIVDNEALGYSYGFWQGYGINGDIELAHNTIEIGYTPSYGYAVYIYAWRAPTYDVDVVNNIIEMNASSGRLYAINGGNVYGDYMSAERNIIYKNTTQTVYHGDFNNTSLANFNSKLSTTTNIDVDPKFNTGTIVPSNPQIANYGLPGYATEDIFGAKRTACGPDVGAAEFYLDHSAANLVFTGTKECSGYSEEVKFDVTNGSSEEMLDMEVYYSIDGGKPVVEKIDTLKGGATKTYTFESIPTFNGSGNMTLEVGLLCDDNDANNTLTHTIEITPAPHSFKLSQGATFNGYWEDGSMTKPDVTVPSQLIEYNVDNPAKYVNGSSDWTLTAFAITNNGTTTTGTNLTAHSAGNAAVISYDPDPTMADSMVFIGLTVVDNTTGCDSTFGRWVYVPHTPMVDFSAEDGCDGEVVAFVNNTTQGTGATEYVWDFGDPASGADNTSTISDPIHRFSTYGTYTVKVTAWNFDYPKFTYDISKTINISPVPSTDFAIKNACEGIDIEFTNTTTLPAGITGNIDYIWNFGDGSATTTMKDVKHTYANPGGYEVTLSASLNGCASAITKNANQFATPVADFSVDGKCNLEDVQFNNASTIALGNAGYAWDFADGSVSNLSNPSHAFDMPGDHTVKLVAISEFGCKDETTKTFTLNESPKADFDFTDPCSETEIEFTRTGTLPDPGTVTSIFEWDFDGERVSTRENDKHKFASVGVKTVTLKVSSDNFCSDEITKEFVVKLQAKADFIANDVCDGDEVVFTNKSEVAAGNLDYVWRFADGSAPNNLTSPRHMYTLPDPTKTENYQVTLLALVPGGCSDSIAKTVTVNAKANADFTASTNGRELTVTPVTNDQTFGYNWRFGDGGRSNDVTPTYRYKVDVDSFEVCLAIINTAGCISEECRTVKVDLVGLNDLDAQDIFNVYPNPNAGVFNVTVNDPASNLNIVIMDATGKVIKTVDTDASGTYNVNISDVAAGVYMVQVINGNYSAMQRVTVAK